MIQKYRTEPPQKLVYAQSRNVSRKSNFPVIGRAGDNRNWPAKRPPYFGVIGKIFPSGFGGSFVSAQYFRKRKRLRGLGNAH
jgi:hypothetical protein